MNQRDGEDLRRGISEGKDQQRQDNASRKRHRVNKSWQMLQGCDAKRVTGRTAQKKSPDQLAGA